MQQAGSQLVITCLQASDNVTLARDIKQYGLKIKQFWANGYDQALLNQYKSVMQGVYVDNVGNVPFQAANSARFGNTYPGMKQYLASMKKYEPSYTLNGVAFTGWESAALLAAGIRAAGSNLTQAGVVNATNQMTNFTAGGVQSPVNWKVSHVGYTVPDCTSYVQVQGIQVRGGPGQGQAGLHLHQHQREEAVHRHPAGGDSGHLTGRSTGRDRRVTPRRRADRPPGRPRRRSWWPPGPATPARCRAPGPAPGG